MEEKTIAIVLVSTIFAILYILGILMLCGKGGILIAGYHYEPKTERAKKYHKKVMAVIGGWYMLLVSDLLAFIVSALLIKKVLMIVFGVLVAVIVIAMLVHVNCNPKILELMRKERDDYSETERYHESEDNYEVHESKDNIEYHESKYDIKYHNCQPSDIKHQDKNKTDLNKEQENTKSKE